MNKPKQDYAPLKHANLLVYQADADCVQHGLLVAVVRIVAASA